MSCSGHSPDYEIIMTSCNLFDVLHITCKGAESTSNVSGECALIITENTADEREENGRGNQLLLTACYMYHIAGNIGGHFQIGDLPSNNVLYSIGRFKFGCMVLYTSI